MVLVAASLWASAPAGAEQKLITIDTPSKHVDESAAIFNEKPETVLQANVVLPDGYDADSTKRWPVLFLLHGAGDSRRSWAREDRGNILDTAKGFPGIIVMPEGGKGFYTNWFNGGKRADPGWERFYLEELIPQIEKDFRIAPGRRNHAIAGLSMGGFGATYLGGQRPDYFGTVSAFSGFVQPQRPTVGAAFQAVAGVPFDEVFGPIDGPYATGHNPTRNAVNLLHTPVYVATGSGVADPAAGSEPASVTAGGIVEAEIYQQNEEFVAALNAAGVENDYFPQLGVHDWPYWRKFLREAIAWGVFRENAVDDPPTWTYKTTATTGRMWGLRFRFAAPPEAVARFERDGGTLRGSGEGVVRIRDIASGCSFEAGLPFERPLPSVAEGDECGRLRVTATPRRVRAGKTASIRVRVTRVVGKRGLPVDDAVVRVGLTEGRTDATGRATVRHRFSRQPGSRSVRVGVPGFKRVLVPLLLG